MPATERFCPWFVRLTVVACWCCRRSLAGAALDEKAEARYHAQSLSLAFRNAAEAALPTVVTLIAKSKPRIPIDRGELREMLKDPRFRQLFPDGVLPFDMPDGEDQEDGEAKPGEAKPEEGKKDEGGKDKGKKDDGELPPLSGLNTQIGSGVVIDPQGVILTNSHVVQGALEVVIRFPDGQEAKATDVKSDPLSDLAIVRVKPERPLAAARLGDSSRLSIGDWVIAIGSPFELEATVSAGIISGMGRGIEKIVRGKLVQTDAAINPGNSGGPLVDLDGNVVGINTAIASSSGGYQGVGFAIPINRAKWVARELQTHGTVRRAYLGILIDELTPEAGKKLKLPPRSGVYVKDVVANGPAEAAGLRVNDVIVEFAGERVRGPRDLQDVVEQKPIDSQQSLAVMRNGKKLPLKVTLKTLP